MFKNLTYFGIFFLAMVSVSYASNDGFESTPAFTIQQSLANQSFDYKIAAGESFSDDLIIKNLDEERQITINLSFGPDSPNETRKSMPKNWIEFESRQISLPPNSEKKVSFTVNVPEEYENGDFRGILQASLAPDKDLQGPSNTVGVNIAVAKSMNVEVVAAKTAGSSFGAGIYQFLSAYRNVLIVVLVLLILSSVVLKKFHKQL